jgi:phosphoserine phosphatase
MTELVATLIARPQNGAQLAAAAETVSAAVAPTGQTVLAENAAIDLSFASDEPLAALRARLHQTVAGRPVDVAVQPVAGRRKKLLIADMDSTIIGQECLDELADFAGFKAKVSAITERAMRGEIAFEPALRERVGLLAGLPESTIERVLAERITLTPGARELVATMRAAGATAILVSGGFTAFTSRIAALAGFDENHANRLIAADGKLTGTVGEPILGREAKLATLEDALVRLGIGAEDVIAVGDGANDLAMLQRAGLGVAYHAKPKVAEAADVRIDHGDLTALLYLQGYAARAFVT